MEDISIRAITIGVGVLIAIATITAVMSYYNSSKDLVQRVGSGVDFPGQYERGIKELLLKKTISGAELKSIVNYFSTKNDGTTITFSKCFTFEKNYSYSSVKENIVDIVITKDTNKDTITNILRKIIPTSRYNIQANPNNNPLQIIVTDVDNPDDNNLKF